LNLIHYHLLSKKQLYYKIINYFLIDYSVKKFSYIIPKIYKVYDANQKYLESFINFNMTILENEIKNNKYLNLK
jgi:hypothetical protein